MEDRLRLLQPIIERANSTLRVEPGDYTDEDGLLICGVCKQPKQMYLPAITGDDPTKRIKVHCSCRCEQEVQAREKEEERKKADMEALSRLRDASLMDRRMQEATFDTFKVNRFNARNHKFCLRYATGFDEMVKKNQGLLMWGDAGTGKSFAAACIANYLLERKVPVVMTSIIRLTDLIMNREEQESTIINRLNKAKLVIFDDFGAERSTDYVAERAYSIMNSRYSSKLPMIVTTNLSLREIEQEQSVKYKRIYDRILENCYPMQFGGDSWRRKEAAKRYDEMEGFLNE